MKRLIVCCCAVAATFLDVRAFAEEPVSKTLADFDNENAVKVAPRQVTTKVVLQPGKSGTKALSFTTEEPGGYPGVALRPVNGKWDLSQFEGVSVDLTNADEDPVRVLVSANDPKNDGQSHTSVGSINLSPRQTRTFLLPFGFWHGRTDVAIDTNNIFEVVVFLQNPKGKRTVIVDNVKAIRFDGAAIEELASNPFFQSLKPAVGRGVNLGNALDAPSEGEWGVTLKEKYFDLIEEAGFDSVRIPVRWSAHAMKAAPYTIDPEFAARVDWVIKNCLDRGLEPLVNIHHYGEVMTDPDGHEERFIELWRQIAERYKDYPPTLKFELLNEPQDKLTSDRWNAMLAKTLPVVRESNPTRQIVVGPGNFNSVAELERLVLPEDDRNLIVTFHYYSPHHFTHQGASWSGPEAQKWLGTTWTGTVAERAAVIRDLNTAIDWAVAHERPIYMGEFGAYSKADLKSRATWTKFLADKAIERKIGFAYWEFCSGFGVYDQQKGEWVEPLREALLGGE